MTKNEWIKWSRALALFFLLSVQHIEGITFEQGESSPMKETKNQCHGVLKLLLLKSIDTLTSEFAGVAIEKHQILQ